MQIVPPIHISRYILVYHTNGRSVKNMIGVIVNRLVGMGLNAYISTMLVNFGDIMPDTSKTNACWDMGGNSHLT